MYMCVFSSWFLDLAGGTTEYVVTVACIIGKSRMKGEKLVTNLLPYGPEKPRSGMVKEAEGNPGTHQVEIFWDPPSGDFTKYMLEVCKVPNLKHSVIELHNPSGAFNPPGSFNRMNSVQSKGSVVPYNISVAQLTNMDENLEGDVPTPVKYSINNKLQAYTIAGLQPGEQYEVELKTKTGDKDSRQPISDIILTKPLPPRNVSIGKVTTSTCALTWQAPENHSCLRGYQLVTRNGSNIINNVSLMKTITRYTIKGLLPGRDYDVRISSLCVAGEGNNIKTESTHSIADVVTQLEKVRNLEMDTATPDSLTIKWDAETISPHLQYRITIDKLDPNQHGLEEKHDEFAGLMKTLSGEHQSYKFPDLKSGVPYRIEMITTSKIKKETKELDATSEPSTKIVMTKPYPPSNLRLDEKENAMVIWDPSDTLNTTSYEVKLKEIDKDGNDMKDGISNSTIIAASDNLYYELPHMLTWDDGPKYVQLSVCAVVDVEFRTLDPKHLRQESIAITDKFKVNFNDPKLEKYVDEQASMMP